MLFLDGKASILFLPASSTLDRSFNHPDRTRAGEEEKGRALYKTQIPWEELVSGRQELGQLAGGIRHNLSASHSSFHSTPPDRSHHLENVSLVPKELTLFLYGRDPS
jgi:hypothetical protein